MQLVLDLSGALMLCVPVKKVDSWTVVLAAILQLVLIPMMLELLAMLQVKNKTIILWRDIGLFICVLHTQSSVTMVIFDWLVETLNLKGE